MAFIFNSKDGENYHEKTVLTSIALAVGFGIAATSAQAANKIGVTIYKYDDNFMSLMRQEIEKEAKALKDVQLLMNDSQNAQSVQNDQVDVLISKGVKVLAINLVDPAAAPTIIKKRPNMIFRLFSSIKIRDKLQLTAMIKPIMSVPIQKSPA